MFSYTPLEDQIRQIYKHIGVTSPEQLDLIDIAAKINIWIHFLDVKSHAQDQHGLYSIIIDRRISKQQQWLDFGHELCHVLLHEGNQLNLPPSFITMQETKARNFMHHFCVPTFMLRNLYIPPQGAVAFVAKTFNVTYEVAQHRLEHYERQIYQSKVDQHIREVTSSKSKPFNLDECTDETKRIVYQLKQQTKKPIFF